MGEELEDSQRFCLDPALEENYHKFLPNGCSHLLVEEGRGTEDEGARRGEKEGLAGAVKGFFSHCSS